MGNQSFSGYDWVQIGFVIREKNYCRLSFVYLCQSLMWLLDVQKCVDLYQENIEFKEIG